jgi:NADPH-dependent ferric siderophore reductase
MAGDRPRAPRTPLTATVVRTEAAGSLVRVVLGGLSAFTPSACTDSYVKLVFPSAEGPRMRTYTVRGFDPAKAELTIDVVVHGDAGLAGPWARTAAAGDTIQLLGPGGDYAPDPTASWHLLVGDESALPAIAVSLEALPADAVAYVFLEVHGTADEIPLESAATVHTRWLHRGAGLPGPLVLEAVAALDFPAGSVQAFVHGEAGMVKQIRRHLVQDRRIHRDQFSISGYWRLGADDEGWRAVKREWNREIEQEELTLS